MERDWRINATSEEGSFKLMELQSAAANFLFQAGTYKAILIMVMIEKLYDYKR